MSKIYHAVSEIGPDNLLGNWTSKKADQAAYVIVIVKVSLTSQVVTWCN